MFECFFFIYVIGCWKNIFVFLQNQKVGVVHYMQLLWLKSRGHSLLEYIRWTLYVYKLTIGGLQVLFFFVFFFVFIIIIIIITTTTFVYFFKFLFRFLKFLNFYLDINFWKETKKNKKKTILMDCIIQIIFVWTFLFNLWEGEEKKNVVQICLLSVVSSLHSTW